MDGDPYNHHGRLMKKPEPKPMTDAEREAYVRNAYALQRAMQNTQAPLYGSQQGLSQNSLLGILGRPW